MVRASTFLLHLLLSLLRLEAIPTRLEAIAFPSKVN